MDTPTDTSLVLAALLEQNSTTIVPAWLKLTNQHVSFRTSPNWEAELLVSCRRGLASVIEYLRSGQASAMDAYLTDLCHVSLEDGFENSEVTVSLLLMKRAVLPILQEAAASFATGVWDLVDCLDTSLNLMVRQFNKFYATEMNTRIKQQHERMSRLLRITLDNQGSAKIDDVLTQAANGIMVTVGMDNSLIYQLDSENDRLVYQRSVRSLNATREVPPFLFSQLEAFLNSGFLVELIQNRQPLVWDNVHTDPRALQVETCMDCLKSILAVPIWALDRLAAVVVVASYPDFRSFTTEQVELAWEMAAMAALAIENDHLYTENSRRLAEVESVQRVTSALLQELKIEKVLEVVCSEAQKLIKAPGSSVYFLEKNESLRLVFYTGTRPNLSRIPLRNSLTGLAALEERTILSNHPGDEVSAPASHTPICLLAAPLVVQSGLIGALDLVNKPGGFTENDARIIRVYADQAAIAIENARLHQQVGYLAVLEERERLAREIHDNVAQALSSLKLQVSFANDLLANGQVEEARVNLAELVKAASEAHTDLREAIFGLRSTPAMDADLVPSLQAYLEKYQARYGLKIHFTPQAEANILLEPHITAQVTRILQEALTNVRKHARADQVEIALERQEGMLVICIEDNGQGFDSTEMNDSDCGGIGLEVMRERAESIKGQLDISSEPGVGTRIQLTVPIIGIR